MKHLKLFFALFAMLALGVGNAWAETAKIDFSAQNYANQKAMTEAVNITNGITVQFAKGGGSTTPAYYTSGTSVRLYAKGTMTVSSTIGTITKITLTYGSSDKTNEITTNCGSFSSPNWTGSATEVVFTVGGTKDHRRIKAVEVTYTPSSGETPGEGGGEDPDEPTLDPDEPETGGETWTLVTNAADLKAGDQVVIAASASNYALGTTQNTNNRAAVSVTKGTNTITIGDDVQIITLETGKVANTFAFNTGSKGYLYAASSSANNLKTNTTLDNNGSWAISITSEGVATIKAQGSYTRNWIRHNSSSAIFSCYSSGQNDVAIYKKVTSTDEPGSGETVVCLIPKNELF